VQTDSGKVLSGIKQRQSDKALIIRDADDKEVEIPLNTIEEQSNGSSLMPAGLTEKLTRPELIDLVRFLSELGKPGPFAVSTTPVARRWEVLQPTKEAYTRLARTSDAQLMADDTDLLWTPAYTTVSGRLPIAELAFFQKDVAIVESFRKVAFVRTTLNVTTAGAIGLKPGESIDGLEFWLDGNPIEAAALSNVTLPVGGHKLSISVDLKKRSTPLRLELVPIAGSLAQTQFVTGK